MATLHFIVEQPFRGVNSNNIEVETLWGTICDIKFVKGKRYLVYAYKEDALPGPDTYTVTLKIPASLSVLPNDDNSSKKYIAAGVVWKDGGAATNAYIELYNGDQSSFSKRG